MSNSTPLLVPVEVQAMVLNNTSVNFIRAQMNYRNLANCQSPSPAPFQEDEGNFASNLDNHGVYLRWTLPQALRHAEQQPGGTLSFPFVPNRWLVVRVYRPAATPNSPQVTAWVVQSDFLHSTDGAVFVKPPQSANLVKPTRAANLTQIQIGQMVPVTASAPWQEPTSSPPPPYFLRAVAESNPAFATYQPFNQNVFSIHDALQTNGVGEGTLSYFVCGWYSDPTADILAGWQPGASGTGFTDWLTQLDWTASTAESSTTTSLYHGAAFAVNWVPQCTPPPSPKDNAHPQIAVGNTSVDAVVAFAKAAFSAPGANPRANLTAQQAADLLEAFQYNLIPLLSQPGGEEQLEQKIRSQWFGSAAAGTQWTIVDAPVPPGSSPSAPLAAGELAKEAAWLAALNTAQRQFDQTMRTLMGVQRQLFELWWKYQAGPEIYLQAGDYPWDTARQFQEASNFAEFDVNGLVGQARTLLTQLAAFAAQIPRATATVTLAEAIAAFATAQDLPAARVLKAVAQPRFWTAADPVTVLSGTAHLLKIDPDATLACRWPSELVTSLNVTTGADGPAFSVTTAALAASLPAVNFTNVPAPAAALYAEFFLLDPANAPLAAAVAGQTALTSAQCDALAESIAAPAPAAGTVPAILAAFPWVQPWQPLYLDWEINWYPVPFQTAGVANWTFNGTDYDLISGYTLPANFSLVQLTGRCVLTPKPSFELKARIDQFITDNPGSAAAAALQGIEDLVGQIDAWDFLSQTLSGFGTQLASWSPVPTLLPPHKMADLFGAQAQCPPNPQLATPGRVKPTSTFEAMRGGQFCFNRLTIVDVFGQTLEIVTAQNYTQTSILPSDGLQVTHSLGTMNAAGYAQLPPRLLQPARLNFQFEPAAAGTNPILGWILPNHIDGGLAVYGVDGAFYGELSPGSNAAGQSAVFWWAAPGTPYATLAALLAAQPQFGGFLSALQSAGATALGDFLHSIDETLWTVDPLGDRSGAFLSVLLGRPLAVVNASISLELQSAAWTDPAWPFTFVNPQPTPLFLNYQFPVQLGNLASRADGLLGYFLDGNYTSFNAVHVVPPGPDEPPSDYLSQIGAGNWINLGFAASGPGPAHALTLVMDPNAAVHAQCGILPAKDVTLVREWVDSALAAMNATFRTGPLLAQMQQLIPSGQTEPVASLLTPTPAERHGTWQWRQLQTDGSWPATPIAPVDGAAVFPDAPPILRDGVLQLSGGLDG